MSDYCLQLQFQFPNLVSERVDSSGLRRGKELQERSFLSKQQKPTFAKVVFEVHELNPQSQKQNQIQKKNEAGSPPGTVLNFRHCLHETLLRSRGRWWLERTSTTKDLKAKTAEARDYHTWLRLRRTPRPSPRSRRAIQVRQAASYGCLQQERKCTVILQQIPSSVPYSLGARLDRFFLHLFLGRILANGSLPLAYDIARCTG